MSSVAPSGSVVEKILASNWKQGVVFFCRPVRFMATSRILVIMSRTERKTLDQSCRAACKNCRAVLYGGDIYSIGSDYGRRLIEVVDDDYDEVTVGFFN